METIEPERNWDVIKEQIDKSKIKRYPWKKILGNSLTEEILILRKQGNTAEETFNILKNNSEINKFIENCGLEGKKVIENIRISVHARYGENNTAKKIMLR